jgi:hypothetical protein
MNELSLSSLTAGSSMDENQRQMARFIFQNPQSLAQLGLAYTPTADQRMMDAANNVDLGKITAIKRALGIEITPNTRVSEDFGALYQQQRRR